MADFVRTKLYKQIDGVRSLAYPETCGDQVVLSDGSTVEDFRADVENRLQNVSAKPPVRMEISGESFSAGDTITVPPYRVGSGNMEVYVGGMLCSQGSDASVDTYQEMGTAGEESTSITWLSDIPSRYEVVILVR